MSTYEEAVPLTGASVVSGHHNYNNHLVSIPGPKIGG